MASVPKQRIACFHGGGSNGQILEVQCARLQNVLRSEFEFVYFDAPFKRSAGPGILPIFADYGPFRSWLKPDGDETELLYGSGFDTTGADGIDRAWSLMRERRKTARDEWVGVLGFSQGTRIASGLLLDQQHRKELGQSHDFDLKFGVICMGSGAPIKSEAGHVAKSMNASLPDPILIQSPTIHLHGLKDVNLPGGRLQMAQYFEPSSATLYEIDYHHAMPWVQKEIEYLADLIKEAYKSRT
ncbi:hypothetical protein BT63DRAFT_427883 [Microthyrium microscopicum]|uniref:Serine hydrolase domain-containing protein n=1 Tax=Microthyrium microscopicum TaxID=703497 RepID=A0A6A6U483_9PEZI|nr:hypothetical protein BT63DRAFT_427883 [Microthyrium microscopicum]